MLEKSILIMDLSNPEHKMYIEKIREDSIPDFINAESGFHIYHVRMLTELILKKIVSTNDNYNYTDEEIEAIATASSLHDVGKTKIPQSILNYPGKLSSVQYDIVKKHSELGEKMITLADADDIEKQIIEYAKKIARCHHERYDGTGYQDGLVSEEIPIYAQAVSLADAYDALTSRRNYKQAFSQDVAVQMIASGMCGAFREDLVTCLMEVVNHMTLVKLREQFTMSRTVVSIADTVAPKRVLLTGNTEYLTKEFLEDTFPDSKMVVLGNKNLESTDRIKSFRLKEPSIEAVFDTYEFDAVVYFARELSYECSEPSDAERLKVILECAQNTERKIKFVYLSSLDTILKANHGASILVSSKEKLCDFYGINSNLDMKIIQIPYLYSGVNEGDFLYKIFEKMYYGKTVKINELAENDIYLMSIKDLSDLLFHIFDNWSSGSGILTVGDDFKLKFSDFACGLEELKATKIVFNGKEESVELKIDNRFLRNQYGWFGKVSIVDDLPLEYEKYIESKKEKEITIWDKVKNYIRKHTFIFKVIELLALFLLTEGLVELTDSAVIFAIVDFRMAFIVIMSLTHGMYFGMSAATLSSLAWLISKISTGTNLLTIFYEPTNWLAFVYFFLIACLCGYVKIKSADQIRFVQAENELLEDKLTFTREIYNDTYNEKRDLKKQIIGSKDSFGKIFDITRRLDTEQPYMLYMRLIDTFENILENKSVTVYSVNDKCAFGRLEVASRDIINEVTRSIDLTHFTPVIKEIQKGNIWKNTEFIGELPMYAAGIYQNEKLKLLIFIWQADIKQQTLYYVNLFKILKDLVQMSLLRALRYNQVMRDKNYLKNTEIMNYQAFSECLANYRELANRKIASCVLLKINTQGYNHEEMYNKIYKMVRNNDILGIDENNNLYLLLTQATKENVGIVIERFEKIGVETEVIE